jgi:flagellar motility protein MotE (MotC chaperone)
LDLPVQLQIITRMKELKSAPILASMDAKKAAEITKAMAAHKSVSSPKDN